MNFRKVSIKDYTKIKKLFSIFSAIIGDSFDIESHSVSLILNIVLSFLDVLGKKG